MKKAIVTGGNKGIGLEITRLLIDKGYFVYVVARDFKDFPFAASSACECVTFDLEKVDQLPELVDKIGAVDVLMNNAGIMHPYTFDNYPEEAKQRMLKVNLEAPVELIRLVTKSMIENGGGRVVNNASIAGEIGHPDIWYGISKAGLINATKSFAKALGSKGIVVNCVAASAATTDMLNTIPEARQKEFLKSVYLGRFVTAEEVAKTMVWLGTESPEYINGICIDINNGAFPR